MGKTQSAVKRLFIPLSVLLGVGIALSWYYFGWVTSQRDYFSKRDFRLLATLGEQIRKKVDSFDQVMDHVVELKDEEKGPYLKTICPELELAPAQVPDDIVDLPPHDPPRLAVERDEGEYQLFFILEPTKGLKPLKTRSKVKDLISPFIGPLSGSFEGILIARIDGTVIFQQSQPGIEVSNIGGLPVTRGGEKIEAKALGKAASSREVTLAGASYTLYSQPLRLSYPNKESSPPIGTVKGKKGVMSAPLAKTDTELEEWIVCGLVRSDRFARDSMAISSTVVLGFGVALLLIVCLGPFIKLNVLRAKERLRARDGVSLAASTFICSALLTFIALDTYYYGFLFRDNTDVQLKKFADSIERNIQDEETLIWNQLSEFDSSAALQKDFGRIKGHEKHPAPDQCGAQSINEKDTFCERLNILETPHSVAPRGFGYPYLNYMIWDDSDGFQRIKWTFEKHVTPFLSMPEYHFPYYESLKKEFDWLRKDPRDPTADRPSGIGLLYSVNTGKNIAVYWRVEEVSDANLVSGENRLLSASLITRPISLIGTVLPAGFQFAVVNSDGLVLFHSDETKNLIENFFEECDRNAKLLSLVAERSSSPLYANYLGRRHHLYVRPVDHSRKAFLKDDASWSLIVFEDMQPQETMNFEALSTSSMLFLIYAGIVAATWFLIHFFWRRYPTKWFWPNENKAATYRLVVILNVVVSVLFFVFILRAEPTKVVLAGFLIPLLVFAITFLLVRQEPQAGASGPFALAWKWLVALVEGTRRPSWQTTHAWARISFMISIAVLPCFAFFRVAYEFEEMLFIHRGQLQLVKSFRNRQERVRSEYQSIALSPENREKVLEEPLGARQKDIPLPSYHADFFETNLSKPASSVGTAWFEGRERLTRLLASLRPAYDQVAADTEAVISDEGSQKEQRAGNRDWYCSLDTHNRLTLASHQDGYSVNSSWPRFQAGWKDWRWWLGLAVFLAILFLFVGRAAEKIFLINLYNPVHSALTNLEAPVSTNQLVMGLPGSGKTKALIQRETARQDIYRLDLAEIAEGKNGQPAEALSEHRNVPIAVDHFEYCAADEAPCSEQKLQLLENLVYEQGRAVMLVSTIDPLNYACGLGGGRWQAAGRKPSPNTPDHTGHRWATLLSSFVRLDFQVPSAVQDHEFHQAVKEFRRKLQPDRKGDSEKQRIVDLFREECSPTPRLRAIGVEFVSRLHNGSDMRPETIVSEVGEQAEAHYSLIWETLSKDEKLILAQLAHEGLINPGNHVVVEQLMKKGLIVRDPTFRLLNRSFTSFVISVLPLRTMEEWEQEGVRFPWSTLRIGLLTAVAALGVFLYLTQQTLFESVAAYVAGIAAAIPALIKFAGMFRRVPGGAGV